MAEVTVVVWNVKTFGDRWNAARGVDYTPICNFIAQALYAVSADVFIMMELRRGGSDHLPRLRDALVQKYATAADGWKYDYIPGSVLASHGYPITDPKHLGFTRKGHSEGYAVLWRDDPDTFTVLSTRVALSQNPDDDGESKIGLVFTGRTPTATAPRPLWFQAPNFDEHAPAAWTRLDFPEPNPARQGEIRWNLSRRPCYVVLNLTRLNADAPPEERLLPIVVHHATNNPFSTPWSVQLAAYSAQLYQVDDTEQDATAMVTVEQAIAAGDFNIDHNDATNWKNEAYDYFTKAFDADGAGDGGANLPTPWVNSKKPPRNYTAVRLNRSDGQPITGSDVNSYRWLAIDNLFIRDLPSVNPPSSFKGPVYNVLSGLRKGLFMVSSAEKRTVIQSFHAAIVAALGAPLPGGGYTNYPHIDEVTGTPCKVQKNDPDGTVRYYAPVIGNLSKYPLYMTDLQNGYFSTARRAAEFYYNSISDHLPLVYRFTV